MSPELVFLELDVSQVLQTIISNNLYVSKITCPFRLTRCFLILYQVDEGINSEIVQLVLQGKKGSIYH